MEIQQHDGVVVDAAVISAGLHQASARGRGVARGEGGAKSMGAVLGNVVISKIYLRTRKIMVMA